MVFFGLCLILLWSVRIDSCASFLFSWLGIMPMQVNPSHPPSHPPIPAPLPSPCPTDRESAGWGSCLYRPNLFRPSPLSSMFPILPSGSHGPANTLLPTPSALVPVLLAGDHVPAPSALTPRLKSHMQHRNSVICRFTVRAHISLSFDAQTSCVQKCHCTSVGLMSLLAQSHAL